MTLLFDTHFLIGIANDEFTAEQRKMIEALSGATERWASVVSFWEIAIKCSIGKLSLGSPLEELPGMLEAYGFSILDIDRFHAMEELRDAPRTRDPFDRLLLAQCQVEGLRLVTFDRALAGHPLAWQPA